MTKWVSFILVVVCVYADTRDGLSSIVTLWPTEVGSRLVHSVSETGWQVDATTNVLGIITTTTQLETQVDSVIETLEITWTPPAINRSPAQTYEHVFGFSSTRGTHSAGLHVHVTARITSTSSHSTTRDGIESGVRDLVQLALPSSFHLIKQQLRILAKVPCNPQSKLDCFSSSSEYVDIPRTQASGIERAVYAAIISGSRIHAWTRLVNVKFSKINESFIQAQSSVVWQTNATVSQHIDGQPLDNAFNTSLIALVSSITTHPNENGDTLSKIKLLSTQGKEWIPSTAILNHPRKLMPLYAQNVAVSIVGEGFHREVHITIKHIKSIMCSSSSIRIVIPLSTHIYIDLDEIRRLERFGLLRLYSETKHIEIERPSAVSTQHMIVLEYPLPNTKEFVLKFPIHFRYQSPSNTMLYAHATVIAPELSVVCHDAISDKNAEVSVTASQDEFRELLSRLTVPLSQTNNGRPLISLTSHPLQIENHDQIVIPVGYTPDEILVSVVTLFVAALGAFILVFVAKASATIPKRS